MRVAKVDGRVGNRQRAESSIFSEIPEDADWDQEQSNNEHRRQEKKNQYAGVRVIGEAEKLKEVSQHQRYAGAGGQNHANATDQIVAEKKNRAQQVRERPWGAGKWGLFRASTRIFSVFGHVFS